MRIQTVTHGPQVWNLWPDYTDPRTAAGDPLYARGAAFARGDVVMQAIDGTDDPSIITTAPNFDYTKDYDDPDAGTHGTIAWQRNVYTPIVTAELANNSQIWVMTGAVAQNAEGRGIDFGRVMVKASLASTTVTAGMKFKLTNAVHLLPAADGGGQAIVVARATKRQVFAATGVNLVEVVFDVKGFGFFVS